MLIAITLTLEFYLILSTITFVKTELIYGKDSVAIPIGNISTIISKVE
jgi:hypothetical protein